MMLKLGRADKELPSSQTQGTGLQAATQTAEVHPSSCSRQLTSGGARSAGTRPSASASPRSAPARSSSSAHRAQPPRAALCRGVAPSGLLQSVGGGNGGGRARRESLHAERAWAQHQRPAR